VAHAAAMGAMAVKARGIGDLESQIVAARGRDIPTVIVIDTDPTPGPDAGGGGFWWDVAVPETGRTGKARAARARYLEQVARQNLVD
jgi:3D-(3,5/4)-trihydroxycyclohexane-1,2-dione acylhydrolase (decyclizing)